MEWFGTACDVIIFAAAVLIAIKNIAEWFGKPIGVFKNKAEQNFEDKVLKILKTALPDLLVAHDLEVRDKYRADREAYLQDIKKEVLKSIQGELGQVCELTEQYKVLVLSAKDVLREKIMQIYFKGRVERKITQHDKEALDQYYIDYKAMKGNSYIDKYYNRMKRWSIADDDYEDEE